jgi:galactose-1-phosphate uridylyltransferase
MVNNLDIPEGHWGIYKDKDNMPLERFDPFRTIINEFGTKVGHITQFSPLRGNRPFEHRENNQEDTELRSHADDSFCKIINGDLPAVVLSLEDQVGKHPLSVKSEKADFSKYSAISIVNLFTPMARVLYEHTQSLDSIQDKSVGIGMVHLITNHYDTLSEASIEETEELLRTTQVAQRNSIQILQEKYNTDKLTTLHFFNIGEEAGASICHLHSQTYIYANEIGHGWTSLGFLSVPGFHKEKMEDENYCLACDVIKNKGKIVDPIDQELLVEERKIFENEEWVLLTAFAPERDGQLRLIPKKHSSKFFELDEKQIKGLAEALVVANKALDRFVKMAHPSMNLLQDRNILFRQENVGYNSDMHMLIDIIPIQRIGGAEIMETYRIATMFPEDVAKIMREK